MPSCLLLLLPLPLLLLLQSPHPVSAAALLGQLLLLLQRLQWLQLLHSLGAACHHH